MASGRAHELKNVLNILTTLDPSGERETEGAELDSDGRTAPYKDTKNETDRQMFTSCDVRGNVVTE